MAYRITATTDKDKELLKHLRDQAWRNRQDVSEIIRESFLRQIFGAKKHWPEEWQ